MERNWFLEINKYGWAGREVEGGGEGSRFKFYSDGYTRRTRVDILNFKRRHLRLTHKLCVSFHFLLVI